MNSTNEYLIRAGERNKILGDLDTSMMSEVDEQENSNHSSESKLTEPSPTEKEVTKNKPFTNDSEDIPAIDASTTSVLSGLRSPTVNNPAIITIKDSPINDASTKTTSALPDLRSPLRTSNKPPPFTFQDSPAPTSPLKAKFAKLSQGYQNFEVDIKPTKTKEDYIHGPVKRISMGGDKPATKYQSPPYAPNQFILPDNASPAKRDQDVLPSKAVDSEPKRDRAVLPKIGVDYQPKRDQAVLPGHAIDNNRVEFNKAKSLFESAFQPSTRYQSPYAAKHEQAVTSIRRYDHPNPTKKPAHCEIVSGPTFMQSVRYWKDRERDVAASNDLVDVATQLFKGPTKRENNSRDVFYSANQQSRNETTSPSPKVSKFAEPPQSAMEQAKKLVCFADDDAEDGAHETSTHTAINSSWNKDQSFGYKPLVVTESFTAFSTLASSSKRLESTTSLSVPSDSFDYETSTSKVADISQPTETASQLSPLGPSLLDDIDLDFKKSHTPITHKVASSQLGGEGEAAGTSKPGLVYSLSNYRKNESTPARDRLVYEHKKDAVQEVMSPNVKNGDEMIRKVAHDQIQTKLKQLELAQTVANNQILQTEKALRVARHTNNKSGYPNYNQEVELLQTLQTLIERRRACYLEFGRLSNAENLYYIFPRATLRFSKIAVDVHRHLDVAPYHYAYLFALVRYNEQVVSSQAVFINPMISQGVGSIEFSDIIEIEDVSPDFSMSIEIYGLTLVRKESKYDTARFNIKRIVSSPQPDRNHPNENFGRIGQVVIDREDLCKQVLDLSSHETPLGGHCRIIVQPKISDIDDNKWSGFVSIYRVVDGKGAWELCYSNIQNNRLNFWRYPEDADTKPPILTINIRDMAELARPCCNEMLNFQNDFEVKVIDSSENIIQIMLSTAEERDRDRVIAAINRSCKYINTWRLS